MRHLSSLDLTGQASEDEPSSNTSHAPKHHSEMHQSALSNKQNNNDPRIKSNEVAEVYERGSRGGGGGSGILTHLPNPIDLWHQRTPLSLLLLPIVFILYVILQLPLHYNSKTENSPTIHTLSSAEWKGRVKDVAKLSNELNVVEKELDVVKDDQAEIKGIVRGLRKRLGKMKERRDRREEMLRRIRLEKEQKRQQQQYEQQQKEETQRGMAKDGPIASLSVVGALGVATFTGKSSSSNVGGSDNMDDAKRKKDD